MAKSKCRVVFYRSAIAMAGLFLVIVFVCLLFARRIRQVDIDSGATRIRVVLGHYVLFGWAEYDAASEIQRTSSSADWRLASSGRIVGRFTATGKWGSVPASYRSAVMVSRICDLSVRDIDALVSDLRYRIRLGQIPTLECNYSATTGCEVFFFDSNSNRVVLPKYSAEE